MSITKIVPTQEFTFAPSTSQPRKVVLNQDGSVADTTGEIQFWSLTDNSSPVVVLSGERGVFVARMQWNGKSMFQGMDLRGPAELRPSRPQEIQQNIRVNRNVVLHGENVGEAQKPTSRINLEYPLDKIDNSTTAIVLIGYNRPNYFKEVVDSLAPQVSDKPVYLFLDKPQEEGQTPMMAEQEQYARSKFKKLAVVKRPVNFGCGMNIIDARDKIFSLHERAFIIEDDMVLDKNYIEYCEKLWDWSQQFSNVGAVQGWSHCLMTPAQKKRNNKVVFPTFQNAWGYLMSAEVWKSIRQHMLDYVSFIREVPYANRDNLRISRFMKTYRDRSFSPDGANPVRLDQLSQNQEREFLENCPTGQDGMTYLALRHMGLVRLAPVANRATYIGKSGIHSTPAMYNKSRLGEVVSSNLKTPDSFELRG